MLLNPRPRQVPRIALLAPLPPHWLPKGSDVAERPDTKVAGGAHASEFVAVIGYVSEPSCPRARL